jgi:PadR family transcriptional regulator PadR
MAKNSERRDLFPGALEIMILQSLRFKPMHGYALVNHIQQVSDDLLRVEEGSLYPALQRMLKEGWLESEAGISAKGRPTRIFRVTEEGIRHLEREVIQFERMFAGITRVLAVATA